LSEVKHATTERKNHLYRIIIIKVLGNFGGCLLPLPGTEFRIRVNPTRSLVTLSELSTRNISAG